MTAKRERLDDGAELVWRYEWDDWDMLSAVVRDLDTIGENYWDYYGKPYADHCDQHYWGTP